MKRAPELRDLSEDHHHGLVLARRSRRAATDAAGAGAPSQGGDVVAVAEAWATAERRFEAELAAHFAIEEETLLPLLAAVGEGELVARILAEHAELRAFVADGAPRTAAALGRFGELLEGHIRFEERVVFERAQEVLSPEQLARVAAATADRPPRTCELG